MLKLQTSRRFVSSSSAPHLVPVCGLVHGLVPHSAHSLIFPVVPPVVAGLGQGHQAQHGLTQTCVHFTLNIHYFNDLGLGELISGLTSSSRHLKLQYFAFIELQHISRTIDDVQSKP